MKKRTKKIFLVLIILILGIQFIPRKLNLNNNTDSSDFIEYFNAPTEIKVLIQTSCYDCHSNNTSYPWYSKIQPISYFLQSHVEEGKNELNFSDFGNLSTRRQKSKFKTIISQIDNGEMPLSSYTLMHNDAKLIDNDKKELLNWLNTIAENL